MVSAVEDDESELPQWPEISHYSSGRALKSRAWQQGQIDSFDGILEGPQSLFRCHIYLIVQAIFRTRSSPIIVYSVARTMPQFERTRLSDLGKSFVYSRSVSGGDLKVVGKRLEPTSVGNVSPCSLFEHYDKAGYSVQAMGLNKPRLP